MASDELFLNGLVKEKFAKILGQDEAKTQLKSALMMDRHVILVGPPGVGKTSFAKSIAKLLKPITVVKGGQFNSDPSDNESPDVKLKIASGEKIEAEEINGEQRFVRVQGSPDLTVEDLIGDIDPIKAMKFGPMSPQAFTPGKIFKANRGLLFFDEVNRCPEKLQNALLQILEEGKATIGNYDVDIAADFIFIGTMNPTDFSGTHSLSEVFLDRCDIINVGYPETVEIESHILDENAMKIEDVKVAAPVQKQIVSFIQSLRDNEKLEKHPSVRATIGLFERGQAYAKLVGEKLVAWKHVEAVIPSVLEHRIKLKPSYKFLIKPKDFLKKALKDFERNAAGFASVAPQRDGGDEVP